MDDRLRAGKGIEGLAEVGQVGRQARAGIAGFAADVDVLDVMAMLAQVAHDPRAALATAARDDDPHRPTSSGQYGGRLSDQGRRAASRTGSRRAA